MPIPLLGHGPRECGTRAKWGYKGLARLSTDREGFGLISQVFGLKSAEVAVI